MSVTTSQPQNISSPNGNSLAVFVDGTTGVLSLKDVNGKIEPISNYICSSPSTESPLRYNSNGTGIEPILGSNDASGNYATIGGGSCNSASGYCNTVAGGYNNVASYNRSTIGGGAYNISSGQQTTVSGGIYNSATCQGGVIGGGRYNNSTEAYGTISGGYRNSTTASYSTVSGGYCNFADGQFSSILGGRYNDTKGFCDVHIVGSCVCATQNCTTFMNCASVENLTVGCFVQVGVNRVLQNAPTTPVAGAIMIIGAGAGSTERCGLLNSANGNYSTISGGFQNINNGFASTISGGKYNCSDCAYSVVGGGYQNCAFGFYASVLSGRGNASTNNYSFIGNGVYNVSSGQNSVVASGAYNTSSSQYSIVSGGKQNNASGANSVISGGQCNISSGVFTTISGGYKNIASCLYATVGGGYCNVSANESSTISGGYCNSSLGKNSFVGGGIRNFARCCNASIIGGQYNDTCGFCNVVISGSSLCATQNCTTFMNCASADNLTVGCMVRVGNNKVLENNVAKIGSFYSTQSQCALSINTPTAMTLNNTDAFSSGISIVSNSRITVDSTGIYNLQFSAQIDRISGSGIDTIDIWYRVQGNDVADTNTKITISGSANQAKTVASWNFFISLTAGQYVELMYSVTDTNIRIVYNAENLTVPYPAIPSLILTMQKIN